MKLELEYTLQDDTVLLEKIEAATKKEALQALKARVADQPFIVVEAWDGERSSTALINRSAIKMIEIFWRDHDDGNTD
jgi:hypothetical protein